jgi:prepilin-type processing-associated H-X9-DG protein
MFKNFFKAEVNGRPLTWKNGCALFGIAFILLVVLGVFLPFGPQPKHIAKRAQCLSNLKKFGTAVQMYAADNSESAPPYLTTSLSIDGQARFVDAVRPYIKSDSFDYIWHCPETPRSLRGEVFSGIEGSGKMSYVHPIEYARFVRKVDSFKLTAIPDPANLPYLRDPIRAIEDDEGSLLIKSGHGLKFNLVFADGHAKVVGMNKHGLDFPTQK